MRRFLPFAILAMLPGSRVLAQTPQPKFDTRIDFGQCAKMRHGVVLSVDVYRPAAESKFPVILVRTPYNKGSQFKNSVYSTDGRYFASHGYVYVAMDIRGRGELRRSIWAAAQ